MVQFKLYHSYLILDYKVISQTVRANSTCPAHISQQIWRRMKRVASDQRLASINPDLLPTGLSALIELIRFPSDRIDTLVRLGILGPELTASRIKEIGASGPIKVYLEAVVDQDGSVTIGGIVRGK